VTRWRKPKRTRPASVPAIFVIPALDQPTRLSKLERRALRVQRDATLSGRCACGAAMPSAVDAKAGDVQNWVMEHQPPCPAAGRTLADLAARLGPALTLELLPVELELSDASARA
jgi:hypothetical protein